MGAPLVIGIGNPDRGDDGAGRAVAARLEARGFSVIACGGDATTLLDLFDGAGAVVIVDAAVSGAAPGTIVRLDLAAGEDPPRRAGTSTHGFGLAEAIALARSFGTLPARCRLFAIEAAGFEHGAGLSPAVADAVAAATDEIAEMLEAACTSTA
jgi:hydrogenase maturation protease